MEGTELPTTFLCHARKRHQVSNLLWQALPFDCPSRPKSDTLTHLGSRTQAAQSPPSRAPFGVRRFVWALWDFGRKRICLHGDWTWLECTSPCRSHWLVRHRVGCMALGARLDRKGRAIRRCHHRGAHVNRFALFLLARLSSATLARLRCDRKRCQFAPRSPHESSSSAGRRRCIQPLESDNYRTLYDPSWRSARSHSCL